MPLAQQIRTLYQTEKVRGAIALSAWCLALWLSAVLPTHPMAVTIIGLTPMVVLLLLFFPEIARLRLQYTERTRNESPIWLYLFALAACGLVVLTGYRFVNSIWNAPTKLSADEFAQPYIQGKYFRITELADSDNIIEGRTFEGCWIYGPAVLVIGPDTSVSRNVFEGSADRVTMAVTQGLIGAATGIVELKDCKFGHCHFVNVTFAESEQFVKYFKENNTGAGTNHPNERAPGAP